MDIIVRGNCAICEDKIVRFFQLKGCPVSLSCLSSIEKYNFCNLNFSQCEKCNTIQLDNLIPLNILYKKSHNLTSFGKLWEGYFNALIEKIQTNINNKTILEVGCPSGKIALNCENYKKWYIIEPNKNDSIKFNDKICFIQTFFDSDVTINDNIDMIIHSHLLEHIYEPNVFLKKCYEMLNDEGEMIFGIPNMRYLAENELCLFVGVFFEHTIFMNKENITYLLNKNGFDILEIIDYVNHSTIYHVKKQKILGCCKLEIQIKNYYDDFMDCVDTYHLFINKCNLIIQNTNKPVYIFGASYNTQFLLSMGLEIKYLTGILDNSVEKQNKYLYGFKLLIYNPEIVIDTDCIVILKNSCYVNEIKDQLLHLNSNTQILM